MSNPTTRQFREWTPGDPDDYTFIETGCYEGRTLAQAAQIFRTSYSIEADFEHYLECRKRFHGNRAVVVLNGDSSVVLYDLLSHLEGDPKLFWLDAHSAPGIDSRIQVPLMKELLEIVRHIMAGDVIAIDDTRCFGSETPDGCDDWTHITMSSVEELLEGCDLVHYAPDKRQWHSSGVLVATKR